LSSQASQNTLSIFEKHKFKTIFALIFCFLLSFLVLSEITLEKFMGLGTPVLYDSNPLYGYRLLPNQTISRFMGATIKTNNLGLRADENWDENKNDKILFLGDSVTYGGSYIDNRALFSFIAVGGLKNFKGGNAGVNAWGIENIYGLIVESNFTPAIIYVTTVPEGSFYRGLTRIQGLPYYNVTPKYAFLELWYYFCYIQNNNKYIYWQHFATDAETKYILENGIKKLKEMDKLLKEKGYSHLIFISPYKSQVFGDANKDHLIQYLLNRYDLNPIYIRDRLNQEDLAQKGKIFHDGTHLEKPGHQIWGRIIGAEIQKLIHKEKITGRPTS
jgi:hypothetical protein